MRQMQLLIFTLYQKIKFHRIKNINPYFSIFSSSIAFQPDFEVIRVYNMKL